MPSSAPNSYEWYEDDILESRQVDSRTVVAGLPETWWTYDWWMAGTAFSGLWLLESWTSGASPLSRPDLLHMAYGLATLLLALASCSVLYKILKPCSERLAPMIVAASGIAMLLAHGA